ncbi:N-glycosylase/DNA lyase [Dirofilaria immitis]|nr:N-glycosylase/DNA lyase [Dirofilaria immitis]
MPLLKCSKEELNLAAVLLSGQSFRWKKLARDDEANNAPSSENIFCGIAKHRVWKIWRENDDQLGYEVLGRFSKARNSDLDALKDYFQLDIKLAPLYKLWAENDKHFAHLLENYRTKLEGIRVLRQDPLETRSIRLLNPMLFGCRNISWYFAKYFLTFYDFADPKRMNDDPALETILRTRGFGKWLGTVLENLSKNTYADAAEELQQIRGIGAKVADCICLMGLPTIWQEKFGPYAGWAQAVLFTAHLRQMNIRRPAKKRLSKIKTKK